MELLESKSLLAKLMATENLVVEQRPVQTASFDVKNRILTLPILDKNISSALYDLFTGHEVGHALYTPIEGMLKVRELKINKDVANVVEDSRIERKIKYKYPGLKNSFAKAYKELMEKDFFGVKGTDINKMNFLDRINLHCKGGAALRIQFNDEEVVLLNEVETTETYDDVIEVSKKIIDYMKKQIELEEQKKAKAKAEHSDEQDEEDYEEVEFDDDGEPLEQKEEQSASGDSGEDEDKEDSDKETEKGQKASDQDGKDELDKKLDEQIRSHTDEAFKKNEQQLFDTSISNIIYTNIPNLDYKQVNDFKVIWKRYKEENFSISTPEFIKIRNESNKVVSYLVKEFELRKNADQLKRATVAKTGDLNMSKIYSYKFNEDIFKKVSVVPGGKSHGLVMFLDWSGSMCDHIGNTVKQLINLVLFCKKQNIPYEVYAFVEDTDTKMSVARAAPKGNDLYTKPYAAMNLLSSRMNSSEFTYACSALVHMSGLGSTTRLYLPYWMHMQGTPLNEAIIHAMSIVPEFQKQNKLQIVNTIFLTDGEGHTLNRYYDPLNMSGSHYGSYYSDYTTHIKCDRLVIRDTVTKHEERIDLRERDSQTNALIRLLKARTKSNVVGFYVINGRDFNRKVYQWFPKQFNHEEMKENFRKNQFTILENTGYDEYYILRSNSLDTDDDSSFEVKENATFRGIASAFTKYNSGKHNSRVILNRFIGLIA
jgi:hypothetical protein